MQSRKTPSSKRFIAIDVSSDFFPPKRLDELAGLYAEIFNGADVVQKKWPPEMAGYLLDERRKRPGSLIALFDRRISRDAQQMKMVGAFFARIVPGRDGMRMTDPYLIVKDSKKYRKEPLERELNWLGKKQASELCLQLFDEKLLIDESQAYQNLKFLEEWRQENSCRMLALYNQSASELVTRPETSSQYPGDVTFHTVKRSELAQLAEFMCDQSTQVSDRGQWTYGRSLVFLRFMHEHNISIVQTAKKGDEILGLMMADIIPRRTGPRLTDLHYFTKGKPKVAAEEVAGALFQKTLVVANGIAWSKYRMAIDRVEVFNGHAAFYKEIGILPNILEDHTYVAAQDFRITPQRGVRRTEYAGGILKI